MNFSEFLTWEYLATMAGCMAATALIVQFCKGLVDKLVHIPTQYLAYIVAFAVLLLAQLFTKQLTVSMAVLDLFNAVLIAAGTSGTIDTVKRIGGGKNG